MIIAFFIHFVDIFLFLLANKLINCFCAFDYMMLVVEKVLRATIVIYVISWTRLCCVVSLSLFWWMTQTTIPVVYYVGRFLKRIFFLIKFQWLVALCLLWSRVLSMHSALFINCTNSSVGLKDCSMLIGCNWNRPLRVLTLKRTTYSQFLKQILFLKLGHDETMIISFDLPCNLWSVDDVFMLTGNIVMWHLNVSLMSHRRVGLTVMATSCCSGGILKSLCFRLNCRSRCSVRRCSGFVLGPFSNLSISHSKLVISSELSASWTVSHSTSFILTLQTFLPYISRHLCVVAPCLIFTETREQTVPLPRGGFSSIYLLDITHIRLIPVYRHNAGSACLCEPYVMLSSPHVVRMRWWRVLLTFK
jgi:hypothetical protein